MKSLVDIQLELKNLMKTIDNLSVDIEKLKPSSNQSETSVVRHIELIAKKYPILNKNLAKASEYEKNLYIAALSMVSYQNTKNLDKKLIYIYRMIVGCNYSCTLDELKKVGMVDIEKILGSLEYIPNKLRNCLILDLLIIANIAGEALDGELELISEIAVLLGRTEEDLRVISQLAKSLLEIDKEQFNKIVSANMYDELNYLIPKEWMKEQCIYCGEIGLTRNEVIGNYISVSFTEKRQEKEEICVNDVKVINGQYVIKGEVIAENVEKDIMLSVLHITMRSLSGGIDKEIKKSLIIAPKSGVIKIIEEIRKDSYNSSREFVVRKLYIYGCFYEEN